MGDMVDMAVEIEDIKRKEMIIIPTFCKFKINVLHLSFYPIIY